MTAELFKNMKEWTNELLSSLTVKALKSACRAAGISWRNFRYKNRKAPYVAALIAHSQQMQNANALVDDTGDIDKKRTQPPTPTDADFALQPPLKKRKRDHESADTDDAEEALKVKKSKLVDDDSDDTDDDTDDEDESSSDDDDTEVTDDEEEDEHSEGGDIEAIKAWSLVKERKCLQWFVDGPGCLARKHSLTHSRPPFAYRHVEQYVKKYMRRRAEIVRAIRCACAHFPVDVVALIAEATAVKPVYSIDEALSRNKFRSWIDRFQIDEFYEHDGGDLSEDGSCQKTILIDMNRTYDSLCMQHGFKSALSTSSQLWSDVLQDFQVKRCKESQCPNCKLHILPRSMYRQKWLLLKEQQCFHCHDCDCGVNWCAEFEMITIECAVNQISGQIRLRSANHGTFEVYQTSDGRIEIDSLKSVCDVLRWFAEYILITDKNYEWRFNQHRVLEKHSKTKKTDCLEL